MKGNYDANQSVIRDYQQRDTKCKKELHGNLGVEKYGN